LLSAISTFWIESEPGPLLLRVAVYFGAPVIALGLLAPITDWPRPRRLLPSRLKLFFLLVGILPLVELLVLSWMKFASLAWYYVFFALIGLIVLAAVCIRSLYANGWRATSVLLGGGAVLYYLLLLVGYYTVMHGDRPRWEEATLYLRQVADVRVGRSDNPEIYATAPGVVAYYLGVRPAETLSTTLVKRVQSVDPPPRENEHSVDRWFLLEASMISAELVPWLAHHCVLKAKFDARSGPKDRTVLIFYCKARASP
jgi:hypothetical protein